MGKVFMSGAARNPASPLAVSPYFEENSWEQIIKACRLKVVPDTWVAGDSKKMTINGTVYQVDVIGRNHDPYSDGSGTAPLTLQLHDCYDTKYAMNTTGTNVGGWGACEMRTIHLPAILALMPSEVRSGIKEVNKLTSEGNKSDTIVTTADKLFLLSETEIFGSVSYAKSGEGSQYAYYKAGNSKVKKYNGSADNWRQRSPTGNWATDFCAVSASGARTGYNASYTTIAMSFAFCF